MVGNEITMRIAVRQWARRLLMPVWAVQVLIGFRPWIPDWMFSIKMEAGDGDNA